MTKLRLPLLKEQLHSRCLAYALDRARVCEDAIKNAQLAANEETKSSAGDKHETGRAVVQLEIEKNMAHLAEAKKLLQVLQQLKTDMKTDKVQAGSLVATSEGNYYLAIGAGKFPIQDELYYAISPASPIGQKLLGLKTHDKFTFNGRQFTVLGVE